MSFPFVATLAKICGSRVTIRVTIRGQKHKHKPEKSDLAPMKIPWQKWLLRVTLYDAKGVIKIYWKGFREVGLGAHLFLLW